MEEEFGATASASNRVKTLAYADLGRWTTPVLAVLALAVAGWGGYDYWRNTMLSLDTIGALIIISALLALVAAWMTLLSRDPGVRLRMGAVFLTASIVLGASSSLFWIAAGCPDTRYHCDPALFLHEAYATLTIGLLCCLVITWVLDRRARERV